MGLISSDADDQIQYIAYLMNSGWSDWTSNMTVLSSERGGDVITALEAKLVGLDEYHVAIHPQMDGVWWDLADDGQTAGTTTTALTAYRVIIERNAPIETKETVITDINDTSNCLYSVGSDEIALWSNNSDLILEEMFLNSSQISKDNNVYFYDYSSDGSITSFLMRGACGHKVGQRGEICQLIQNNKLK